MTVGEVEEYYRSRDIFRLTFKNPYFSQTDIEKYLSAFKMKYKLVSLNMDDWTALERLALSLLFESVGQEGPHKVVKPPIIFRRAGSRKKLPQPS